MKTCTKCGRTDSGKRAFSVDHDHISGKVRGLLCVNCNIGIGQFKDSISLMNRAIIYLRVNHG